MGTPPMLRMACDQKSRLWLVVLVAILILLLLANYLWLRRVT
jgi:hypothetical protein